MAVIHFHVFIQAGELLPGTSSVLCHHEDPAETNILASRGLEFVPPLFK